MVGDASPIDPKLSIFAQEQLTRCWDRVVHNIGSLSLEQFEALRDAVQANGYHRMVVHLDQPIAMTLYPVGEAPPRVGAPVMPAHYETDPDDREVDR